MPRVLLDCPGPPRFMPSFSLCYSDGGSERVEMGQAVDEAGNMQMGDLHLGQGAFEEIDPSDVLSVADSKGCNSNGATCHDSVGGAEYSSRIDPWDTNTFGNPDCIIDTDGCDPDKQAIEEPSTCFEEDGAPRTATPESLEQVCQCIRDAADPDDPDYDPEDPIANEAYDYLRSLCDALEIYQSTRGACVAAGCPEATGPPCDEPEASCDPSDGSTTGVMAGYHCRAVEGDGYQCIADCPCRDYDLLGGGKFLVNGAVTMVRVELDGLVATADPDVFTDGDAISGTLSAFNYLTRTQVDSVSLTSLEVTRTGADFSVAGAGTASVNGVTTNIEFDASQTGGDANFELRNADTSAVLAGGIGEDARSAFQLTVGP
jgi:hypothetical protein